MPYNVLGDLQTLEMGDGCESSNPCCILTIDCCVCLMGNITLTNYTANSPIATVADTMKPLEAIRFSAFMDDTPVCVNVDTNGIISIPIDVESGTLYLNGKNFNVSGTYYNDEIGNNFYQGTSPLRYNERMV